MKTIKTYKGQINVTNYGKTFPLDPPSFQIQIQDNDGEDIHYADLTTTAQVDELIEVLEEMKQQMGEA